MAPKKPVKLVEPIGPVKLVEPIGPVKLVEPVERAEKKALITRINFDIGDVDFAVRYAEIHMKKGLY